MSCAMWVVNDSELLDIASLHCRIHKLYDDPLDIWLVPLNTFLFTPIKS